MSNYSSCPISENGIHAISYNKFAGKAICVFCGFILTQVEPKQPIDKKIDFVKTGFHEYNLRQRRVGRI